MTYDHHCIFLGTCIGLKNRLLFLVFLLFQLNYISLSMFVQAIQLLGPLREDEIDVDPTGFFAAYIIIIFLKIPLFFMVFYLLLYQIYLISVNLTFYEYKRWKFISYLKEISLESQTSKVNLFLKDGTCLKSWLIFFRYTFTSPPENTSIWQL